jgi:hypothetical protein
MDGGLSLLDRARDLLFEGDCQRAEHFGLCMHRIAAVHARSFVAKLRSLLFNNLSRNAFGLIPFHRLQL